MSEGTARPRWAARNPGTPMRMNRLRFLDAPAGDGTAGAGAGDAGAAADGTPAGTGAPSPADVAAQAAAAAAAAQGAASTDEAGKVEDLPDWAQKQIRDLRAENASSRTNAKATAAQEAREGLVQELGKALGLVTDGQEAPKPEELAAQLAEQQSAARTAQVELAVFKAATTAGADPQALLDSRTFLASVKDSDPADTAAITAAITKAITDNPRLKATQAAARSGADLTGGTGEARTPRAPKPLTEAVSGHYAG